MASNRYHHFAWYHGMELFEAAFSTQTFARHAHEGFAIGAIVDGVGGYVCRGESMTVPAGSLSLMNPQEAHTGHAAAGQVRYSMLYASESAVRAVLGLRVLRGFPDIATRDRDLKVTRALARLTHGLHAPGTTDRRLVAEEAMHDILALTFTHYARADLRQPGREPVAIQRMIDRIRSGVETGEALSLADLAADTGWNPSYLIRATARATGMTPHGHVLHARVEFARRLLLDGMPAAQAALAAGFSDQAHLIRHFRRHYGVTPGALIRH
ncbi:AraC family transcriptional regulator [Novosphingobium rosa]|uniref:AraC family transcriptional regulator n=1 Tax=Novosphingobium rosa TaxID=76978 RepID=UPI0012ED8682|nr:AraC family transcriptional regulator [Novosphingobium rosa]